MHLPVYFVMTADLECPSTLSTPRSLNRDKPQAISGFRTPSSGREIPINKYNEMSQEIIFGNNEFVNGAEECFISILSMIDLQRFVMGDKKGKDLTCSAELVRLHKRG